MMKLAGEMAERDFEEEAASGCVLAERRKTMLNVGVIGCGGMGRDHIRRLTNVITSTKVVAVSDVFEEGGKKVAEQYGVKFYKEGADLINDPEVQAVVVCTADPFHAPLVLECIKAGKYVFCEKPLAPTAEDCKKVVDAEMAFGRRLVQVGFMRRYDNGYRAMKKVIEEGKIGAPLLIHACHRNFSHVPGHTSDMTIANSGIHELDVLRWLVGEDYVKGGVICGKQNRGEDPEILLDPQVMILETKTGVRIDVEINQHAGYGYDIQCEVVGEKGVVSLPDPATVHTRLDCQAGYEIYHDWTQRFVQAYDTEFEEWAKSVEAGELVGPSSWDGYAACIGADACNRARNEGVYMMPIELPETPEFYR